MRKLFFFVCGLFLALLLLLLAPQLRADGTDMDTFTYTEFDTSGNTLFTMAWQLPATPGFSGPGSFTISDVSFTSCSGAPQCSSPAIFTFFPVLSAGGFIEFQGSTSNPVLNFISYSDQGFSQVYSTLNGVVTFDLGTYNGLVNTDPATLTISAVTTPEPSAILLLFSGFLALAAALALKKVSA